MPRLLQKASRERSSLLHLSLLGAALLIVPTLAAATTFIQQPFPEAVSDAPVIVRGKIGGSTVDSGRTGGDSGQRLYTYYELRVTEPLKGDLQGQEKLTMREMGGAKGGVGMHVAGAAQFTTGEEVVVFLNDRNSDGTYDVRGMMMGKYNLRTQADGTEVLTGPGLAGDGKTITTDDTANRAQTGTGAASPWSLDRLRQLIDEQKSSPPREESPRNPVPSPSARTVAQPSPTPLETKPTAAPRLQSDIPEETPAPSGFWSQVELTWIVAALAALAVLFWLFGRSRG
jgi:hypothetical protein